MGPQVLRFGVRRFAVHRLPITAGSSSCLYRPLLHQSLRAGRCNTAADHQPPATLLIRLCVRKYSMVSIEPRQPVAHNAKKVKEAGYRKLFQACLQ
jgi:hypothetical protein